MVINRFAMIDTLHDDAPGLVLLFINCVTCLVRASRSIRMSFKIHYHIMSV